MGKWIGFFVFVFIGSSLLSAWMIGGDGLAAARLNESLTSSDTTITVISTSGFYSGGGEIVIDKEHLTYTGLTDTSFTGVTRGYAGTDAVTHNSEAMIYTLYTDQVNQAMGYQVVTNTANGGANINVLTMGFGFLFNNLPQMLTFNFNFLQGDLAIIQYFMFAGSISVIIGIGLLFINVATTLIKSFTGGVG